MQDDPPSSSGLLRTLRMLGAGELPLPVAFWRFGIFYGTILNVVLLCAALALLAAEVPGWLGVVAFVLPIPYNILVAFGVWRSADAWQGAPVWQLLARVGIIGWAVVVSLI